MLLHDPGFLPHFVRGRCVGCDMTGMTRPDISPHCPGRRQLSLRGKTSSGGRNDSQNARHEFSAEKVYPLPFVVTESHAFAIIALNLHRQAWNRQWRVIAGRQRIDEVLNCVLHTSMLMQNHTRAPWGITLSLHCARRSEHFGNRNGFENLTQALRLRPQCGHPPCGRRFV
jgi:hypothetical protein